VIILTKQCLIEEESLLNVLDVQQSIHILILVLFYFLEQKDWKQGTNIKFNEKYIVIFQLAVTKAISIFL